MNRINLPLKAKAVYSLLFLYFFTAGIALGQDVTTIQAADGDISDNLDLEAVASIFGESKDLEDFEKRLNDPNTQISNLDLNNDGEVDYLRIMETAEKNVHSISIQAVIGKDQYQEVATIDVEKDSKGATQVQVVGNVDMYGPNYYVTPHYHVIPVFFTFFWMATYRPWYSPWHWGYHPPYFRPWRPYPPYTYRNNVHVHVNINNNYNRTNVRMNNTININNKNNAYFRNNPDKSFHKRNPGVNNRAELNNRRKSTLNDKGINNRADLERAAKGRGINTDKGYKSSGRPATKPNTRPTTKPATTRPSQKPTTKPATTRPSQKPSTRPATKPPTTRPSQKPSTRPATKPATRPTTTRQPKNTSARPSSYSRKAPSRSSPRRTRH